MTDAKPAALSAAHAPFIILGLLLVLAVILGVATGSLNENSLKQVVAQPGDPITIP